MGIGPIHMTRKTKKEGIPITGESSVKQILERYPSGSMDFADLIGILAIILECLIAVIAVLIAWRNGKAYGWLIVITFALFALFDLVRIFFPNGFPRIHALVLLIACGSMLYAVWLIYENTMKS